MDGTDGSRAAGNRLLGQSPGLDPERRLAGMGQAVSEHDDTKVAPLGELTAGIFVAAVGGSSG